MENIISEISSDNKHVILMGDLNVDMSTDTIDTYLFQLMLNIGNYHLVPYESTHWTDHSSTWIDHIFVSSELSDIITSSSQTHRPFISAHDCISVEINFERLIKSPLYVKCRNYTHLDSEALSSLVTRKLCSIELNQSVDHILSSANTSLLGVLEQNAPERNLKLTCRTYTPWLTRDIKNVIKQRDTYRRLYRRYGHPMHTAEYKKLRGFVKALIFTARKSYLDDALNVAEPRVMWGELRRLKMVKSKKSHSSLFNLDPDCLNSYFLSMQCSSPPLSLHSVESPLLSAPFDDSLFYFPYVTPQLLFESWSFTSSSTSPSDGLPPRFLSLCSSSLFPFLLELFNASLSSCIFPSDWKRSIVTPIPKLSHPTLPSHFRPISILPEMSKILERVVLKEAISFMEKNKLLDPYQHAFRAGHSTQTAILKLITDARIAADEARVTLVLSFDLSKAFDSVDHAILVQKLAAHRFSSSVCRWFESYLKGRSQAVRIEGRTSEWLDVTTGVPQGSVLGPFLFSIFINDLNDVIKHGNIVKYADDLLFYYHSNYYDAECLLQDLEADIAALLTWLSRNGMVLNAHKTRSMIFGSSRSIQLFHSFLPAPYITVSSAKIPFSSTLKYLGVILTPSLSWREHVVSVCGRICSIISSLAQHRRSLSRDIKIKLMKSLILPHVDYCCLALLGISAVDELRLERALNTAIRFIYNVRRDEHITPFRAKLRWLTVKARREYFLGKLMFSINAGNAPSVLANYFAKAADFPRAHSTRSTADKTKFVVPLTRTNIGGYSIAAFGSRLWNGLPSEIREAQSESVFATCFYKRLLGTAID